MKFGDPYFRLQAARRALHVASHKHAHTKNKSNHDVAVDNLEKAALVFTLCAAEHGAHTGISEPVNSEPEKP